MRGRLWQVIAILSMVLAGCTETPDDVAAPAQQQPETAAPPAQPTTSPPGTDPNPDLPGTALVCEGACSWPNVALMGAKNWVAVNATSDSELSAFVLLGSLLGDDPPSFGHGCDETARETEKIGFRVVAPSGRVTDAIYAIDLTNRAWFFPISFEEPGWHFVFGFSECLDTPMLPWAGQEHPMRLLNESHLGTRILDLRVGPDNLQVETGNAEIHAGPESGDILRGARTWSIGPAVGSATLLDGDIALERADGRAYTVSQISQLTSFTQMPTANGHTLVVRGADVVGASTGSLWQVSVEMQVLSQELLVAFAMKSPVLPITMAEP